jgi:hypothetical protein
MSVSVSIRYDQTEIDPCFFEDEQIILSQLKKDINDSYYMYTLVENLSLVNDF